VNSSQVFQQIRTQFKPTLGWVCYLEEYWAWVGTWAPRFSWQDVPGLVNNMRAGRFNDTVCSRFGYTFRIGGVEENPGPRIKARALFKGYIKGVIES